MRNKNTRENGLRSHELTVECFKRPLSQWNIPIFYRNISVYKNNKCIHVLTLLHLQVQARILHCTTDVIIGIHVTICKRILSIKFWYLRLVSGQTNKRGLNNESAQLRRPTFIEM